MSDDMAVLRAICGLVVIVAIIVGIMLSGNGEGPTP